MSAFTKSRLVPILERHVCCTVFTKKYTGLRRTMICTLRPDLIPRNEEPPAYKAKTLETLLVVWDMEKHDWRAFHDHSVLEFTSDLQLPMGPYDATARIAGYTLAARR